MHVDQRTLVDLGILPDSRGDWPLRVLLDRTHTPRSGHALRRLLGDPLADAAEIRRRQRVLQELPSLLAAVQWTPLLATCQGVERYLSSTWVVVPPSAIARRAFLLRHGEIGQYVDEQLSVVGSLLDLMRHIWHRIKLLDGDAAFRQIAAALEACVDGEFAAALDRASAHRVDRRFQRCGLDHAAREEERATIEEAIAQLHRLDAFHSLALTAAGSGFVYPALDPGPGAGFAAHRARHPLLSRGAPNDIAFDAAQRIVFLTGPNMAGKSTLLRTIGIIVHFAHVGLPVPAERASVPLTARLISSINVEDSIARGESMYLAEVRRLRTIVSAVADGERVVALVDEAFRGTNVKDAVEAMGLLVDGLARADTGLFVLASHLVEVAQARGDVPAVARWCMHVDGDAFTYALRPGVSEVRLGVRLLEREGVLGLLRGIQPV